MIVDKDMNLMKDLLKEKDVKIAYSKKARSFLAEKGYDPKFGARPLQRLIQTEIKDKLSDQILFGKLSKGGTVSLGCRNKKLTFNYKS